MFCLIGTIPFQVLGIAPCQKLANLSTASLATVMIKYMKAPEGKKVVYTRNLALLVSTLCIADTSSMYHSEYVCIHRFVVLICANDFYSVNM